jgi:two-component system, cell cycle sensor histidine kinase and response regulator CckA
MVPPAGRKEVATSHPTPTCKAAEPTTVNSGHEVLLHELAALRHSEAALRDFIETSTIGLHWVGADGTILWVNQAELDLLGYAREEYVGRNIAEFHADESVINDMLGRLSRGETLRNYPARLRHCDGSIRHVLVDSSVLFEDGKFVHTRCFTRDVTDSKHMGEALRKSEERFRLATKATNDAIWDIDLKTGIVSWNETYTTLYGGPPDTSESWQWWIDNIHAEDRERTVGDLQIAIGNGASSWTCEYRFRRVDGEWADIYDRAYIARDASGNAWRVIGAMQDLTDRKQAEARLRESEELFRSTANAAPVIMWLGDTEKQVTFINRQAAVFTGIPTEKLSARGWAQVIHPDDLETVRSVHYDAVDRRVGYQVEYRARRADGEYRHMLGTATPRYVGHEYAGHVGSLIDITDMKVRQQEDLTHQKWESIGTLAGGIAHDFNNLLGGVLALAELALGTLDTGSPARDELESIRDVAIRGSEIVRQLMIYAGKESEIPKLLDLSEIVEDMLALLKVSVSKHATIKTDLDKQLPMVRANAAQVSQVVMNLVRNASEAIGDRDGKIHVTTRRVTLGADSPSIDRLAEGEYVQLEVSDTGCGMSPEERGRVFDPFFSTKSAGRGMGLAVVHGIVRTLGGTIHLASELGHGTTFLILLPCAEAASGVMREPISDIGQPDWPSQVTTVLIVEDEDPLRQAASKMLQKLGFSVIEARDGSAALEVIRAKENPIDVLFLDVTLPGTPGREVLEEASRLRPDMRVVVTSAYTEEMAFASLQTRVERFIRKPYRLNDLAGLIQPNLAERRQRSREAYRLPAARA